MVAIAMMTAPTIESKKKEAITNTAALQIWYLYALLSSLTIKLAMMKSPAISEMMFPISIFKGKLIMSIGVTIILVILCNS